MSYTSESLLLLIKNATSQSLFQIYWIESLGTWEGPKDMDFNNILVKLNIGFPA